MTTDRPLILSPFLQIKSIFWPPTFNNSIFLGPISEYRGSRGVHHHSTWKPPFHHSPHICYWATNLNNSASLTSMKVNQKWTAWTWEDANASYSTSGTLSPKTMKSLVHLYGAWARNILDMYQWLHQKATPVSIKMKPRWWYLSLLIIRATNSRFRRGWAWFRGPRTRRNNTDLWDSPWVAQSIRMRFRVEDLDNI